MDATKSYLIASILVIGLVACASESEKLQQAGARAVTPAEMAKMKVGNTSEGEDGSWYVYYSEDGRKIFMPKSGDEVVRHWRMTDEGVMCEEFVASGEEYCDNGTEQHYELDGVYTTLTSDGRTVRYRFLPGNPKNL